MDRKLYKIVVADDENTIRRGICNFIDWKRMGYQIVADFEDGKEPDSRQLQGKGDIQNRQ